MSVIGDKIVTQQSLSDQIRELQKQEKELRLEILGELFGQNVIGNVRHALPESNIIVTGEYGLTYTLDQEGIGIAYETGELSAFAQDAIRVKYELNKRVYDQLGDDLKEEIDQFLTVKPSLPSLKVKYVQESE